MSAAAIASVGLMLNMAGVTIAFFFGYPQPAHEEGIGLGLEDATPLPDGRTVAQHNEEIRHRKAKYLFWSRAGLCLMFIGFLLQFVAVWMVVL
jgi:hypothetical protein